MWLIEYRCVDWEWVSSWSIWGREEEDQYRNGTDHRAPGAVSRWAHHWTGCQHCCFCDTATQTVSYVYLLSTVWLGYLLLTSRLSEKGNNIVIMSIHQPRYSIFKLLDTLTLLSAGNVVYHGQANNALEYFHGAGRLTVQCLCIF